MNNRDFTPLEIHLDQDSAQWREWRRDGLGSSDSAIIMGLSPFETVENLWLYKTGQREQVVEETPAILNGKRLEPIARRDFIRQCGEQIVPKCMVHPDKSWMRVSLDGISLDGYFIWECKSPLFFGSHRKMKKEIPPYYYAQIQKQLFVSNAELAIFWSYTQSSWWIHEVGRHEKFIEESVLREDLFWNESVKQKSPPREKDFLPFVYDRKDESRLS